MKPDSIYSEWICFPLIHTAVHIILLLDRRAFFVMGVGPVPFLIGAGPVIPHRSGSYVMLVLFKFIIGGRPICMSGTKWIFGRTNTGMSCFLLAEKIRETLRFQSLSRKLEPCPLHPRLGWPWCQAWSQFWFPLHLLTSCLTFLWLVSSPVKYS